MFKCELCCKDLEEEDVIVSNDDAHTCDLYCHDCFYKKGIKDLKKGDFIYIIEKGEKENEKNQTK